MQRETEEEGVKEEKKRDRGGWERGSKRGEGGERQKEPVALFMAGDIID